MHDSARRQLEELLAAHGPSLGDDPALCQQLLQERCPHGAGHVSLLIQALEQGVVAQLRADAVPPAFLARRLAEAAGVPEGEARWAVNSWATALGKRPAAAPLPEISFAAEAPPQNVDPHSRRAAAVGAKAGVLTGLLAGFAFGTLGMVALGRGQPAGAWWLLVGWLLGCPLLAGGLGWLIGPVVGATQKELAGGIIGAVLGAAGGALYSPLLGALVGPLGPPPAGAALRLLLGTLLGIVAGTLIGIFHQPLWNRWRRYRYDALTGQPYQMSAVEQEIRDELDRRAGI
jgi:hypothetical protein